MKFRLFLYIFTVLASVQQVAAQNQPEALTQAVDTSFVLHEVKSGETIFSLCEKYQVTQKELVAANPDLLFGLKPGNSLQIPVRQNVGFTEHIVKRKQTVFSIARRYRITLDELYLFNPQARKGIQAGQKLRIPIELEEIKNIAPEATADIAEEHIIQQNQVATEEKHIEYFTHQLALGETFFDLEKRFGISQDTLIKLNPALNKGLKPGLSIRIPATNIPESKPVPVNESEFIRHTVREGETIYLLADLYQVRIADLKKANPELQYRGVLPDEELLVPDMRQRIKKYDYQLQDTIWTYPAYQILNDSKQTANISTRKQAVKGKTYHVALMLPLYLNSNDTINRIRVSKTDLLSDSLNLSSIRKNNTFPKDTFIIRKEKIIDSRAENFIHFYEGVLLATDSLRKQGFPIQLHVFDTRRDSLIVKAIIRQEKFLNMDLIIGPVFPELQRAVSAFSAKNRIPMVSPLSAAGNFENWNPYYFKINPTKDFLIDRTAEWITDEYFNSRFFVLKMGEYKHLQEADLVEQCRNRLNATGYYAQSKENLFVEYNAAANGFHGLPNLLSSRRENVFIIPATSEGQISVAITNLNTLAEKYNIRVIGLSSFKNYKSIQPEYFHQVQLQYLTHYFIDYQSLPVNRFVGLFRQQFGTEPNEFSFQGFDVAYYFMSALHRFGKELKNQISGYQLPLNQLNLNFQKVSKTGGVMNQGVFDIGYQKDFSIKNNGLVNPASALPKKNDVN